MQCRILVTTKCNLKCEYFYLNGKEYTKQEWIKLTQKKPKKLYKPWG